MMWYAVFGFGFFVGGFFGFLVAALCAAAKEGDRR